MAADDTREARTAWNRGHAPGFEWVSSSPSPAQVTELESRFPEIVLIPAAILEESSGCWMEKGVLARTYHRWVPPDAFVREFRRAGISGDIHTVCLAHRCYIFRFEASGAQELVIGRPWVVNGQPVATESWRPDFVPAMDSLPSALLWVRLPALPMEYWVDSVLEAILAPVGKFIAADPATRSLSRGAFARACVRVDLRQPLRPGVQIQGSASPFWQSFQFEHMSGICSDCGSIHLLGPCSPSAQSPEPAPSAPGPLFGPWMSVTRQRKSSAPVQAQSVSFGSPSGASVPSRSDAGRRGSPANGRAPSRKQLRRSPLMAGRGRGRSPVPEVPPLSGLPQIATEINSVPVKGSRASLIPLASESQLLAPSSDIQGLLLKNPFALLNESNGDHSQVPRMDANPGPSKRARPEESMPLRLSSNNGNRKGKGSSSKSKDPKKNVINSDPMIPCKGHVASINEPDKALCYQVTEGDMLLGQPSKGDIRCKDLVLSCRMVATHDQPLDPGIPVADPCSLESAAEAGSQGFDNTLMDCNSQLMEGAALISGHPDDLTMVEDQGGTHPSTIC